MKISFGILCHDEIESLETLLQSIIDNHGDYDYEIVVIHDNNENKETEKLLDKFRQSNNIIVYEHPLNNDYATQKNYLTQKCNGTWIVNPDADETLPEYLLHNIQLIIEHNNVELIWMPRVNIVEGLTPEWVGKWRWQVNEQGWVNWPDYQARIYKNDYPRIHWENKVHEKVVGFESYTVLPDTLEYADFVALKHIKQLERQIKQNEKYDKIIKEK